MGKHGGRRRRVRKIRHWWYTTPNSRIAMIGVSAGLVCTFLVVVGLVELGH